MSNYDAICLGDIISQGEHHTAYVLDASSVSAVNAIVSGLIDETSARWLDASDIHAFRHLAVTALARDGDTLGTPVLIDQGTGRMLALWIAALDEAVACPTHAILLSPPPHHAGGQPDLSGWARYYLHAERLTRGRKRYFISAGAVEAKAAAARSTLANMLGADRADAIMPPPADANADDRAAIWDRALADLLHGLPVARELFRILSAWAAGAPEDAATHGALDRLGAELAASADAIESDDPRGFSNAEHKRATELALFDALSSQRALRDRLTTSERQITALTTVIDEGQRGAADEADRLHALIRASHDDSKQLKRRYNLLVDRFERTLMSLNSKKAEANAARVRSFGGAPSGKRASWLVRSYSRAAKAIGLPGADRSPLARAAATLRASDLFDAEWYMARYPDVAATGADPVRHYLEHGWQEGREPGPNFSTTGYLEANGDVAATGVNPLLHYIEHGRAEGRDVRFNVPAVVLRSTQDFGPAAPCLSLPIARIEQPFWLRQHQLAGTGEAVQAIDGYAYGVAAADGSSTDIAAPLLRFHTLSGIEAKAGTATDLLDLEAEAGDVALVDAWFVGGRLRTRWHRPDGAPFVVRAFQHTRGGAIRSIADALVTGSLDATDFTLPNRWLPVLAVFAAPDGAVIGARLIAFPSLLRGGAHHSELLAHADSQAGPLAPPVDALAVGRQLATRLLALRGGAAAALVGSIAVDLAAADGTETLFQSEFQHWLATVVQVSVSADPVSAADRTGIDYLADAAQLTAAGAGRSRGAALILPADTIPTIDALAASDTDGAGGDALSLIVARSDPAASAALVTIAPAEHLPLHIRAPGFHRPFPALAGARGGALAIRPASAQPMTAAEIIIPLAQPLLPIGLDADAPPPKATLALVPGDWDEELLDQALRAIAAQRGADSLSLAFCGPTRRSTLALAQALFGGRCRRHMLWRDLLAATDDPLFGYIGADIILHDDRTMAVMGALLGHDGCLSASSVVIGCEKRGKSWHATPVDAGTIVSADGGLPAPALLAPDIARGLWRSVYPVAHPPRDFWIAHRSTVRIGQDGLPDPARRTDGFHLSTALVTTSYGGVPRVAEPAALSDPALRAEHALSVRNLVG